MKAHQTWIAISLGIALAFAALPAQAATDTFTISGNPRMPPLTVTPPSTTLHPGDTAAFLNQAGGSITVTLMDSAGAFAGNNCIFSSPTATCDLSLPIAGAYSGCVGSTAGSCDFAKFSFQVDATPPVPALPSSWIAALGVALAFSGWRVGRRALRRSEAKAVGA